MRLYFFYRAWKYIAVSAAAALLISFLWIVLLRYFAGEILVILFLVNVMIGFIVWATIILVVCAITALAYLCYHTSTNIHQAYSNLPVVIHLVSEKDSAKALMGLFYALVVIDAIVLLAILCMIHRISIAIGMSYCSVSLCLRQHVGIIKEASKVMLKIPTILFVPLFIDLALIPLAVYFIYIGAYVHKHYVLQL